jgi:hypothetical protein
MEENKRKYLLNISKQLDLIDKLIEVSSEYNEYPTSFSDSELRIAEMLSSEVSNLLKLKEMLKHKFPELKNPAFL